MNKLKILLGMVTLLTISIASAQVTTSDGEVIAGSPYVDDKYKDGMIYLATRTIQLRYATTLIRIS